MKHSRTRSIHIVSLLSIALLHAPACAVATNEWTNRHLLDESGRQLVPGGFVVLENIDYSPDDYHRMVRMGANFQVIRMPIGRIGGLPGTKPDSPTLKRFDAMVRMGIDCTRRRTARPQSGPRPNSSAGKRTGSA